MKSSSYFLLSLLFFLLVSAEENSLPVVKNEAFQPGEKLRYRVTYGFMDAGEALMEVNETSKKVNGRDMLHLKGTGRTLGGFNAFYKVYDVYS